MAGTVVQDEFTAPKTQAGLLESRRGRVQQLFAVSLTILGTLNPLPLSHGDNGDQRIWLQLQGSQEAVARAKEYIKGICEPELEEKLYYPKEIHCVFAGAQNLFLDRLIHDSSADISITELGILCINGRTESVVLAQSHIYQFVQLFESNMSLPPTKESAVKKRFKCFVEKHADKYTMDLLLLPCSLKEELLNLTSNANALELEDDHDLLDLEIVNYSCNRKSSQKTKDGLSSEKVRSKPGTPVTELTKQMDTVLSEAPGENFSCLNGVFPVQESSLFKERVSCKRRCSDFEERCTKKQFSLEGKYENPTGPFGPVTVVDVVDLSDSCSDLEDSVIFVKDYDVSEETEYKILVNFFKTMGYAKEIVEKVIAEFGRSEEPLKLLDEIEKEHKRIQEEKAPIPSATNILRDISANKINISCADKGLGILHGQRSQKDPPDCSSGKSSVVGQATDCQQVKPNMQKKCFRTAANFSVTPTTTKIHDGRGSNSTTTANSIEIAKRSVENLVTRKNALKETDFIARGSSEPPPQNTVLIKTMTLKEQLTVSSDEINKPPILPPQVKNLLNPSQIASFPNPRDENSANLPDKPKKCRVEQTVNIEHNTFIGPFDTTSQRCLVQATVKPNNAAFGGNQKLHAPAVNLLNDLIPGGKQTPIPTSSLNNRGSTATDPSVTGRQRFFNTIQVPYRLQLQNEPGRADLKHIIIDGSNVAMSHGLRHYFSCRGIALAVEYFWKHGHRNITVFVPQWRTKRDPNITEQNFLLQLEALGILSFTPARMVLGSRIASHDDRFLLHLSEKTGGVMVTNDNFREFVTESAAWKQIIKERILQYTFAGDIFMVPDDPLGRNGPKLQDFLRQQPVQYTHFQQPNFQQIHFHQPLFQQPHFSNVPTAQVPRNSSGPAQLNTTATTDGVQPPLNKGTDRLSMTPQLQQVQPCMTIPSQRTEAETTQLKCALLNIFPESQQRQKIDKMLTAHPYMRDLNALSALVLD